MTEALPSFEQIVDAHYASLYRFALSMSGQEAAAQDIVQQTFLQWARKGHMLREPSKVKTWLFTTLRREWLRLALDEKKKRHIEFDPDVHDVAHDHEEACPRVELAALQFALDQLHPQYRATLVFFYIKELSYRDIAEVLGVPIGTVMSRLSRAKNILRSMLIRLEGAASGGLVLAGGLGCR